MFTRIFAKLATEISHAPAKHLLVFYIKDDILRRHPPPQQARRENYLERKLGGGSLIKIRSRLSKMNK